MDVPLQRDRVAVVEVEAERLGVELVQELPSRRHLMLGQRAVHGRRMPAVEMHGVGVRALVEEADADPIALGGAQRRAGHLAVVGPGREEDAGRDLDLAIDGVDLVLAQQRAVGARRLAVVALALGRRQIGEVPAAEVDRGVERRGVDGALDAHQMAAVTVRSEGRASAVGRGPAGQAGAERADAGGAENGASAETCGHGVGDGGCGIILKTQNYGIGETKSQPLPAPNRCPPAPSRTT